MTRAAKTFERGEAVEAMERIGDCWSAATYERATNGGTWHLVVFPGGLTLPVPSRRIRKRAK